MAFALSRLTGLARRRRRAEGALADMPVLRRADAHPDAPPRRPILASSDLGLHTPFVQPESPFVESAITESPEEAATPPMEEVARPVVEPAVAQAEPRAARLPSPALEQLSVAELMQRIERGFARRRDVPPAEPAAPKRPIFAESVASVEEAVIETEAAPFVPPVTAPPRVIADIPPVARVAVRDHVEAEVDEALRVALGTLQKISTR